MSISLSLAQQLSVCTSCKRVRHMGRYIYIAALYMYGFLCFLINSAPIYSSSDCPHTETLTLISCHAHHIHIYLMLESLSELGVGCVFYRCGQHL